METSAVRMVPLVDADLLILDYAANPYPREIEERTNNFVQTIREAQLEAPIIMAGPIIRITTNFNKKSQERVRLQNRNFCDVYTKIKEME